MGKKRTVRGTMVEADDPTWEPLLAAVGGHHAEWFKWMYEIELADGSRVHAYKHVITRCYMHLSEDGRAFSSIGHHRYREIDPDYAAELGLPLHPGEAGDDPAQWGA
jgi:hypothetical protein